MTSSTQSGALLDVASFAVDEQPGQSFEVELGTTHAHPFLRVYQSEDGYTATDPTTSEYSVFLNELHDEEFDQAIYQLVSEASGVYDRFIGELSDPRPAAFEAEQILERMFGPLATEAENIIGSVAARLNERDVATLTEAEIDSVVDQHRPATELTPSFENFFGALKNALKKVVKKGVSLAKKGLAAVATLGLGPILNKLKGLIKPLLRRVLRKAIHRLPGSLQPIATKLAQRLPFLNELDQEHAFATTDLPVATLSQIQDEFNYQVANLLFATTEAEQTFELSQLQSESSTPVDHTLPELDTARADFVDALGRLKQGEDPTPHLEQFVPLLLPALNLGLRVAGRKYVVRFLAKFLAPFVSRFIAPEHAQTLSRAIVDAGLGLMGLEATAEEASRAGASVVAATVEDTVRRVAALPDHILDNPELLESYALQAFEQAAAANMPPLLAEETYRTRPDLIEARSIRGVWIPLPLRDHRKRYKKYGRTIRITITPRKAQTIESFAGAPLSDFLEEQLGALPGEELEATVHLYESVPGTTLADVARLEEHTPGLGAAEGFQQFHPLTTQAAGLLMGEPALGRDTEGESLDGPHDVEVGQRFYYLEVPGKRPLAAAPGAGVGVRVRRRSRVGVVLDFNTNQVRIYVYLSELRTQELALKLRQHGAQGTFATFLGGILERGLTAAVNRKRRRLTLIHDSVTPDRWGSALNRLPQFTMAGLRAQLHKLSLRAIVEHLKQHPHEFASMADKPADGLTMVITISGPEGLSALGQALKGKSPPSGSLRLGDSAQQISVRVTAGYLSNV